jgi:phage shock protein PspC (stress-responsive transcriptional regulator)
MDTERSEPTERASDQDGGAGRAWSPRGRRLTRPREGRVLGGVAQGLGAYLDVDPVVVRVLFAGLAFVLGGGVALYLLAWLLVPEEGADASLGEVWLRNLSELPVGVRVGLLVVAGIVVLGSLGPVSTAGAVVAVAALAVVLLRGSHARPQG